MENKKKYLAELSDITAPFFLKTQQSYKLHQQTPSKFSSSALSDIFPELQTRSHMMLEKASKLKTRPITAVSSASILKLEADHKLKALAHTTTIQDFNNYMNSIKYFQSLSNELNINYLLVSTENNKKSSEDLIPLIPPDSLSAKSITESFKKLTIEFRSHLQPTYHCKCLETLWRGALRLLDYSFLISDLMKAEIQKEYEELCDFRIDEVQKQYDIIKIDSAVRIQKLTDELESSKAYALGLEQELMLKGRVIIERERKIEEMNNFENRTFTIYRLKRMIKGLTDFITETESEQDKQEKTLNGISTILRLTDKLRKPPKIESCGIQTQCSTIINRVNIKELSLPLISINPLYYFVKLPEKFIQINDKDLMEFCEGVLAGESTGSFASVFLGKCIENRYDGMRVHEILAKLHDLEKIGLKWPVIFKKLLGIDSFIIGNLWKFVKNLEFLLKSQKFVYFIDLSTVINLLYKLFPLETFRVHRVIYDLNIFEPVDETKSFQPTSLKRVEIILLKLNFELKKRQISIKSLLNDPTQKSSVTKSIFTTFLLSLPMYLNERNCNEVWDFIAGPSESQISQKSLTDRLDPKSRLEKAKSLYVDKFDLILRLISEWESLQEKFLEVLKHCSSFNSSKDIAWVFKEQGFDLNSRSTLSILLAVHSGQSLESLQLPEADLIDTTLNRKRKKSEGPKQ